MTPARFRWGILLILLGTLFLLRNLEVLNDNFWGDLLIWFPIFLIAIGLEKIFTNTRLSIISYLTSVFLFFGGLYIAFAGSYGGPETGYFSEFTYRQETRPTIDVIKARVEIEDTDLTIRDSGDDLIYAKFDKYTRKPEIESDERGNEAILNFNSRSGSFWGGLIKVELDETQDWYMRFAEDIPLEMECVGYKADLQLNFSTTPLRRLRLESDESKVYLRLGDIEPFIRVEVAGENSRVRLRVPGDAGLKVIGDEYEHYLQRLGLVRSGDAFTNPEFEDFRTQIEVQLGRNLGSLSIDYF